VKFVDVVLNQMKKKCMNKILRRH